MHSTCGYGVVQTTIRVLSYSTTAAAPENQRPCSEKTKKDELISVAVEMGLVIPNKAKIIDLKKLIESSAVYKDDIEFVRSLVENALEKKKAFQIKSVPDELKAEILLNILGERVNNLLTYVSQEDLSNYVKIKELILREFEPTPQECLSNFKKARKLPSENYVQFASRLSETFDYYCQLRKVNEFRSLCDLIISDKIFEMLDRDTMNHIATKQGETYFKPQQLGRECDVYLSPRGKVSNNLMSRNPGSGVKTDGRNRLQTVGTWRQERNSSNVFVAKPKQIVFYVRPGKFYCDNSHLVLQNTVFGYVVSGSVDQVTENRVHCRLIVDDDLNKTLKKFWEIEGVHIEPKVDTEASLCEDHFVRTHRRNCEGRYVVSMALNKVPSCLGNSKDIAIRRLNSLRKWLSRDSSYLSLYAEFLKEYEELGHLERVVESSEPPTHYYIPYHGVLRPEKLTTKLRIVFNGSSPHHNRNKP
ncbi:integrase catalytic domain-containing protein [Trichonephila clavipes]|nr:integrase catalytic domain-containing protein [Trichonephila clavipes]